MSRRWLAVDIEVSENQEKFKRLGNGVYRGDSYVLGVSFADDLGMNKYLTLGHEDTPIVERRRNIDVVKDLLLDPCDKITASGMYDYDYLVNKHGFEVKGSMYDVQHAESLIGEHFGAYSLDAIAGRYLNRKKKKDILQEFCDSHGLKGDPRAHLAKMPFSLVEEYAKEDTALLVPIIELQIKELEAQGLTELYAMERKLFPILTRMKKTGIRIDEKKRQEVEVIHRDNLGRLEKEWYSKYPGVNYGSSKQLAIIFDREEIPFEVSNAGKKLLLEKLERSVDPKRLDGVNEKPLFEELRMSKEEQRKYYLQYPSIDALVLDMAKEAHPTATSVWSMKKIAKTLGTYINGYFQEQVTEGRIHPSFYPYMNDESGTLSGRFSSSNPNAQNIGVAKGGFDPLCRNIMIPEDGQSWFKIDFSQMEYRLIASYSVGPGSANIKAQYNKDPKTDYHEMIQKMVGVDRKTAKTLNFALAYNMSYKSMAKKYMWDLKHAKELYDQYMHLAPFLKATNRLVEDVVTKRGYIYSVLGRRSRYSDKMRAEKKSYVFLNRLCQSGCADFMKKSMTDANEAGVFSYLTPTITVHDELDGSFHLDKAGVEAFKELKHIMENCIKINVPVIASAEYGKNWAEVNEADFDEMLKGAQT